MRTSKNEGALFHQCACEACHSHPSGETAREHRAINRLTAGLDERMRRLFAGFWANIFGSGGVEALAGITGMSVKTVRRGRKELFHFGGKRTSRIRRAGGGRKHAETTSSRLNHELEDLLRDTTAGDPVTGMKWTHKSVRKVHLALRQRGIRVGRMTVARQLHKRRYSLRTNRKTLAGTSDPDRNQQFLYLTRIRRWYMTHGLPVVSIDAKKKEKIGNFKNPGATWRRECREVLDHDFMRDAKGIGIPFGIYDLAHNDGYVVVGISHETADFDVNCLRRWWTIVGRRRYPNAKRLLIEADCGGGNSNRTHGWKVALQRFADEFNVIVSVTHYPSGASKWNPIEHRMFSLISANWAGEPLTSYETMLNFIRATRSTTGFHCKACIDRHEYRTGKKITNDEWEAVRLKPRSILPRWNYSIVPHEH